MHTNANNHFIRQCNALHQHINMAIGYGIKRPWIKCDPFHGRGDNLCPVILQTKRGKNAISLFAIVFVQTSLWFEVTLQQGFHCYLLDQHLGHHLPPLQAHHLPRLLHRPHRQHLKSARQRQHAHHQPLRRP